ncbi:MAG: hypothetical protein U0235_05820 [Polyangiaceae bacterium]
MDGAKHTETTPALRLPLGIERPPATEGRLRVTSLLVLLAVLSVLPLPMALWQRVVLGVVALAGLLRVALAVRAQKRVPPLGEILLDGAHVERRSRRGTTELASFAAPFGLAVFADPRRTRGSLAFTTPTSARYLTARLGDEAEGAVVADRALLARAAAVAESDALGAQLDEATLSSADAERLLAFVEKRAPEATERIFVSGPAGEPIVLERRALKVGTKVFDLTAPLEWKAFMFHETVGAMAMLYHATWVRQDMSEVVLVSPMPPEVSSLFADGPDQVRAVVERSSEMQRAVARDLRVMQAAADAPPPVETRIAVERMFMFPLRRALDTAPRARVSVPPFRSVPRERNLAK